MEWIFGKPLSELSLEDLRSFLADAGDEPLTWEVKGDERERRWVRREQVLSNVCAFANSDRGGVLLIGGHKRRAARGWELPGIARPRDEPGPLLEKWVRDGFIRRPRTHIQTWDTEDGCVVAAVGVWPTPDPPCVTGDGQVFQRTSGETVAVRDPVILARLVDQGRRAWRDAHDRVVTATEALFRIEDPRFHQPGELEWRPFVFAVAASSTGLPEDVELRPFLADTADRLQRVTEGLPRAQYDANLALYSVDQESYAETTLRFDRSWTALLHRDGAAGIAYGWRYDDDSIDGLGGPHGPLMKSWTAAVDLLVTRIGGTGRGRFRVLLNGRLPRFGRRHAPFYVDRAIELAAPSVNEVESVVREIKRATGDPALEPPAT